MIGNPLKMHYCKGNDRKPLKKTLKHSPVHGIRRGVAVLTEEQLIRQATEKWAVAGAAKLVPTGRESPKKGFEKG